MQVTPQNVIEAIEMVLKDSTQTPNERLNQIKKIADKFLPIDEKKLDEETKEINNAGKKPRIKQSAINRVYKYSTGHRNK